MAGRLRLRATKQLHTGRYQRLRRAGWVSMRRSVGPNYEWEEWWHVGCDEDLLAAHRDACRRYCGDRFLGWWRALAEAVKFANRRGWRGRCWDWAADMYLHQPDLFWYYFGNRVTRDSAEATVHDQRRVSIQQR